MEQFVGTVETQAFNDVNSQEGHREPTADYIRPAAMKSDYLDAAVNPAARPI
jgi:hypothetical protein